MKQALSTGIADCDSNADNAMKVHMCDDSVALVRCFRNPVHMRKNKANWPAHETICQNQDLNKYSLR